MSTGKVCIKTGVMTNIQEDILVVIEGREYQVHVKEIAPQEPDVADDGSLYEDENKLNDPLEEGYGDHFDGETDYDN